MDKHEKIAKEGSKAFELIEQLRKHAKVCFTKGDFKYEAVMSNISALEQLFKPYVLELEQIREKRKKNKIQQKQICTENGHVGEWVEQTYYIKTYIDHEPVDYPMKKWKRKCKRCGKVDVSETKPIEVVEAENLKKIRELEEEIIRVKASK